MKKKSSVTYYLLVLICQAIAINMSAQIGNTRSRSVYGELLGPSNGIGVNYDARLRKGSPWGYRIGLGFGYMRSNWFFGNEESVRGYTLPFGVSYLIGQKKNKMELGVGLGASLYNEHKLMYEAETESNVASGGNGRWIDKKYTYTSAFLYTTIGYRRTASHGFQLRVGVTPAFMLDNKYSINRKIIMSPYVSFGKAF